MTASKMELRRAEEAAPTEPGLYFACNKLYGGNIKPREVIMYGEELRVNLFGFEHHWFLEDFKWFGPVPTCIESGEKA